MSTELTIVGSIFLIGFIVFCALYGMLAISGLISQDDEDAGLERRS